MASVHLRAAYHSSTSGLNTGTRASTRLSIQSNCRSRSASSVQSTSSSSNFTREALRPSWRSQINPSPRDDSSADRCYATWSRIFLASESRKKTSARRLLVRASIAAATCVPLRAKGRVTIHPCGYVREFRNSVDSFLAACSLNASQYAF